MIKDRLKDLIDMVGYKAKEFDDNGVYSGCLFPLYFMFPEVYRPEITPALCANGYNFGMSEVIKNATEIHKEQLEPGDVIIVRLRKTLHPAIYLGNNEIIHIFHNQSLVINNINMFKDFICKYFRRSVNDAKPTSQS